MYPTTQQEEVKQYKIGEHLKIQSSRKRNELISSGEWKEIILTTDGWYVLEKIK